VINNNFGRIFYFFRFGQFSVEKRAFLPTI